MRVRNRHSLVLPPPLCIPMTASSASSQDTPSTQANTPQPMRFGSGAFAEALDRAAAPGEGAGASFVLAGASAARCQEVLALVAERTSLNVHQFKMPNLLGERYIDTQGHLREVFDKTDSAAALIYFAEADALFAPPPHEDAPAEDEHTPVDYLFERMDAFGGVVLVCFSDAAHVRTAQEHGMQIVTFD